MFKWISLDNGINTAYIQAAELRFQEIGRKMVIHPIILWNLEVFPTRSSASELTIDRSHENHHESQV